MSEELRDFISPTTEEELQTIGEQSYSGTFAPTATSGSNHGTHVDGNGTKIEDWFDDAKNIEAYCLERLAEIFEINKASKTPSAFSCIFACNRQCDGNRPKALGGGGSFSDSLLIRSLDPLLAAQSIGHAI